MAVFSELDQNYKNTGWLISRDILTFKNRFLSDINQTGVESFLVKARECRSFDTVGNDQEEDHPHHIQFFNNFTAGSALPDHKLKLKKWVIMALIQIIDLCKTHVNGSRYTLSGMTPNTLHFILATG